MSSPARRYNPTTDKATGPALTPEELTGNLSQMQNRLNAEMKCTAGRNQVYIRSVISGRRPSRPRIALKCPFRRDINRSPDVFYEYIRDVCCSDPEQCEAWRAFKKRFVET